MQTSFSTTILGLGNNAGIEIPAENISELGSGKRPPVSVTIGNYTYKSTVGIMHGKSMIPLAKAHREASGLAAGDNVTVTLELDEGVRDVAVPADLQAALEKEGLVAEFSKLAYSKRKEFARQAAEAKTEDTKLRRIAKVISSLQQTS